VRTHAFLVINPRSGGDSPGAGELAAAARRLGVAVHLLRPGEDPGEPARASGAEVLGVAGGDGSLGAVAGVALETGAAFVCVPFGTRNHFARDVGLDRSDPLAALAAFSDGAVERRIDVGRVDGRLFLNNVSLGVYARLVHRRERHRRRNEALAGVRALAAVSRRRHTLHAVVNGEPVRARVVFVGNTAYELSLFTVGERERLDQGELFLWTAGGLLPTAWERRTGPRFRIETRRPHVRAAIDGEPTVLETPVELESLPRALRLLLPGEGGAMHESPEPTEREQELAQTERQNEEESQRYPSGLEAPPAKPPAPGREDDGGQPDAPDDASE
jgi:diacylglycerol kinase family enzyme